MTQRPVVVYLDSSDFSRLSAPNAPSNIQQTRERLTLMAKDPVIHFVFSGAHISEMAPLEARYTEAAARRTDLLVELCGRKCLIGLDRLMKGEIERLSRQLPEPVCAISERGEWFPDVGQIVTPSQAIEAVKSVDKQVNELGISRSDRRALKSKMTKGGRLRPNALSPLGSSDLDDLLKSYPMRKQDAEVIMRYLVGTATAKQADQAFLESLRDPRWMIRWFHEHHHRLGPVGEWVRGPALKVTEKLKDLAKIAAEAHEHERLTGKNPLTDQLTPKGWQQGQNELLLNVANDVASALFTHANPITDAQLVDNFCPGIAMCMRVMHSSLRNAVSKVPREPTSNDFVDAVHSMYAPYVDIFRGDRYMSPIIATHAAKYGTKVVAKLEDVPASIEWVLAT